MILGLATTEGRGHNPAEAPQHGFLPSGRMIPPSPTAPIAPTLARGVFAGLTPETATKPGFITLEIPTSNYRLHLIPTTPVTVAVGKRLIGTVAVQARRVDETKTGGRFIEPVYGRPRRVQGNIVAVDAASKTIVVNAGVPIHVKLTDPGQKAAEFSIGQFVGMDVLDGGTFTPES